MRKNLYTHATTHEKGLFTYATLHVKGFLVKPIAGTGLKAEIDHVYGNVFSHAWPRVLNVLPYTTGGRNRKVVKWTT